MKRTKYLFLSFLLMAGIGVQGQQLPDPHFEDWSDSFDGNAQLKDWHGSNVSQMGFKFTFLYKKDGRTGSCAYVTNQEVGAMGVKETAPGYFSLGRAWSAIEGISTSTGTGGTEGGISFKYRPDTLSVWIKRTGSGATGEDFNIVFYSWQGTSQGVSYRSKGGSCKSSNHTDEECDIRQTMNGNSCGTSVQAKQVAEGWHRERKQYAQWTNIRVPIYYLNDVTPEKVNVIFSAGNAPNAFSNAGITKGNDLYVDDVELIYSCRIQKLYIDGLEWKGFNPDTEAEQVYSLGEGAAAVPDIFAMRGAGTLTNSQNKTGTFPGRRLSDDELSVKKGGVGEVTTLTVKSGDGKTTMTYRIKFVKQASSNANLAGIKVDGKAYEGFNTYSNETEITLDYGTTAVPDIEPVGADEGQTFEVTQAKTLSDVTTIKVTAADGKATHTYTFRFKVGELSDNTLKDILIDGVSLPDFSPQQVNYTVSLPLSTTAVPEVKAVSAYKEGDQTIVHEAPAKMENNCQYKIKVSTKGNPVPKAYIITFKLEASSITYLTAITLDGQLIDGFDKAKYTYDVTLPMGATAIPLIGYEKGDPDQTVTMNGMDVNGTTVITVKAANGSQAVYKINFTTPQSENTLLKAIYINGSLVDGFVSTQSKYAITLPAGSGADNFPSITWETSDEFQTVEMVKGSIPGTTRLVVTAGNGSTAQYQLVFTVEKDEANHLNMIYIDGKELPGFDKDVLSYTYTVSPTATVLPTVTYERGSENEKVSEQKPSGLTGDYVLTVRPQKGQTRVYTITFTQNLSANANLKMIRLDGKDLEDFSPTKYNYTRTLPVGTTTLPEVTCETQEEGQKTAVVRQGDDYVITVTAQDGKTKNTYRVSFTIQQAANTLLEAVYLNGELLDGFDPGTTVYTITLPVGSTDSDFPTITWKTSDEYQKVEMTPGGINGTTRLVVTAGNGATGQYQLRFSVAQDEANHLNMIYIDGKELPGFDKETLSYTYTLGADATVLPAVTYDKGSEYQKVTEKKPADLTGDYTLTVRPQKGQTRTYTITFTQDISSNANLRMIRIDGKDMEGFSPTRYTYTYTLPVGATELPAVTYEQQEAAQKVVAAPQGDDYVMTVIAQDGKTKNTYRVSFTFQQAANTLLEGIYLNGKLIDGFERTKTVYSVTLPIGSTEEDFPAITWKTTDEYQKVEMTPGGINGTTRIFVTAGNGATAQYQIVFSVADDETNHLNMIYIDGKELPGFDKETLAYTYMLGPDVTVLPAVTYELGSEYQKVKENKPSGLTGNYMITVRPRKGQSRTYTITFTQNLSANALLKMIRLDGKDLEGFDAAQYTYTYTLPAGTTTLPEVTYEQQEETQKVVAVRQGNDCILTVRAQDGKTVSTYRITFTILQSDNAFLKMIYLDGEPLAGFEQDVFHYTHTLTSATCPAITVAKGDDVQQVTIAAPYADGTAQIVVRPQAGSANTYTITFVSTFVPSALLKGINLDGVPMADFQPDQKTYTVPMTTDALPEVTAVTEEGQTVQILISGNTVTVFVRSGELTGRYDLAFTRTVSTDCTLRSVLIDGVALDGFSPDVHTYTHTMAAGSPMPEVTYVRNEEHQTVHKGQTGGATVQLVVIAEDGTTTATYTILFDIPADNDTRLKNIALEGVTDFEYDEDNDYYEIFYEDGISLPAILIETKPGQTAIINTTGPDAQRIDVRAADGVTTGYYTIQYIRMRSDHVQLKDIQIEGVSIEGFDPAVTSYSYTLPWRTEVVPSIQPIGMLPTQTITTRRSSVNGKTVIIVKAPDGMATGEYTVSFPVAKSDNTDLSGISLPFNPDLQLEPAFSTEVTDYEVFLPYGFDTVPAVHYQKVLREQSVQQIIRGLNETSEIIVTAENGDMRTYNLKFTVKDPTEENLLSLLRIVETNDTLLGKVKEVFDKTKRDFTANLPFGSRSMTVEYKKSYGTQTVFIESGGVLGVTRVTAQSNVKGVDDEVYTITPNVDPKDPAVLTDIKVNGKTIDGFDPEQFSYIVNVKNVPVIDYTLNEGASINYTPSSKHWQATITYGTRVNTYHIWFYFEDDVVPNMDFEEWENAMTTTSARKPKGWNVLADFAPAYTYAFAFTFTPGEEVQQDGSNSVAYLHTQYNTAPLAGYVPGYMTLGTIDYVYGRFGSSSFSVRGGITFRNTPDEMSVRFKNDKVNNNSRILYKLNGSGGEKTLLQEEGTTSGYVTRTLNLAEANAVANEPTQLNIVFNSFDSESGKNGTAGSEAQMYVDWLRLSFNHTLTGLTVNGIPATLTGNDFTVTLSDPEAIEVPQLTFTGEVADQAQTVTWTAETSSGEYGVRTAAIRNFAENGTDYTDYTLEVKRPLATVNTLSDILIGGKLLEGFDSGVTEYTITITPSDVLPDIDAHTTSSRATLSTTITHDDITLTVTPEYGEAKTYTVHIHWALDSNTTLKSITASKGAIVPDFDPATRDYTLVSDTMPDFYFVKGHAWQTVTAANGILTVRAEDGTEEAYHITLVPEEHTTTAQLKDISLDSQPLAGFSPDVYEYHPGETPVTVLYHQVDNRDSLVFIQEETGMTFHLFGSPVEVRHTYRIVYPTDYSSEARLKNIFVNDQPLDGFDPDKYDYTLATDDAVVITVEKTEDAQTLDISEADGVYTIVVTAEDGVATATYTLAIVPELSGESQLAMIYADGTEVEGFRSDSTYYIITLPAPAAKTAEPLLPVITYDRRQAQQQVEVQAASMGQSTFINVTAENGAKTAYELLIQAEPSHNAWLTGIIVNGVPIERFASTRFHYSAQSPASKCAVEWASEDNFQTVTLTETEYTDRTAYTLHVVAQDGVTMNDYQVEIFLKTVSGNTELSDILLDGVTMDRFETELNPGLSFSLDNTMYRISLPAAMTVLPQVSARLKEEGQTADVTYTGDQVLITVTARDGVSKRVYTLDFQRALSSDATLDMIYLNGEELQGFDPGMTDYSVTLPDGVAALPYVTALTKEGQTPVITQATDKTLRATVFVTAQDGTATQFYTVGFSLTLSDNADLRMLYLDGEELTYEQNGETQAFSPDEHFYTITLPVGTEYFPDLMWEKGDMSQTVEKTVLSKTETSKTEQVTVTAASGRQSSYTVNYSITLSDNTLLDMIIVDDKPLSGFSAAQTEYFYTMPKGQTVLPKVEYIAGDNYQVVRRDTLSDPIQGTIGEKVTLTVTAQNGRSSVYTVHFTQNLSSDVTLDMIYLDGTELEGFDPNTFYYPVVLAEGVTRLPDVMPLNKSTQTVEITQATDQNKRATIVVTAETGLTQTYTIDFTLTLNDDTSLKMLYLDGDTLTYTQNGETLAFTPDVHVYTVILPVGTEHFPNLTWDLADDKTQKVEKTPLTETGNLKTEQLTVTAATGRQGVYTVNFEIQLSDNTMLDMITVDGKPLDGFSPEQTEYFYAVAAGETELPKVEYVEGDEYQVIRQDTLPDQITGMKTLGLKVTVTVTAQNGRTRVYTVHFVMNLSSDATLEMIYLDGVELAGFEPSTFFYSVALEDGATTLPEVLPISKAGQEVQITPATGGTMRATILVKAEDGLTQAAYTIVFSVTVNDNTELKMMYLDGEQLTYEQGEQTFVFTPSVRSYSITLPVGTTAFPDLTWDKGDPSQQVAGTVLSETDTRKSEQVEVTAPNGSKGVYTVTYEILLSDNTMLDMITVDGKLLSGFTPEQTEYFYTVASAKSPLPNVEYETADNYQVVRMDTLEEQIKGMKSIGKKITITVTAQNGQSRVYTVHFPVAPSGESQIGMIYVDGEPLEGFDKDVYHYTYEVPYDGTDQHRMPNVTYDKKPGQNVDLKPEGDSVMDVHVTAEDGVHGEHYYIRFTYGKSPDTALKDILLDGQSYGEYNAAVYTYEIRLFDDAPMPAVEWIKGDPDQQLSEQADDAVMDGKRYVTLSCEVTAPDGETRATYSIVFAFVWNPQDTQPVAIRMDSLLVRGLPVSRENGFDHDFAADTLVYQMTPYPLETPENGFFTEEDVRYVTADTRVQAAMVTDDKRHPQDGTLVERVIRITLFSTVPGDTAHAQYSLVQNIAFSHDSAIVMILLDGEPLADFDPEVHHYQIPVTGKIPGVTAIAADTSAEVSILPDGDARVITCVSQYAGIFNEGGRNTYTVEFVESPINQAARIEPNDVMVKHIPGSTQIAVACIRKDAQLAVFSEDGHLVFYRALQAIDPRYAIVAKNANGQDCFIDVTDLSQCTVLTLDPHKLYFYSVYQGGKRKVTSGKLLFIP